ncbi:unnamed protein product [Protopolystoma xenopodis]|uniref:RRM domain-containing protein n=1 Tax=Protopolystoma xenopodis TaxID=117903 RepID=A0A448XKD5_9PLAT|nr:unnamed protein product [Protopolystoma xenopodis]
MCELIVHNILSCHHSLLEGQHSAKFPLTSSSDPLGFGESGEICCDRIISPNDRILVESVGLPDSLPFLSFASLPPLPSSISYSKSTYPSTPVSKASTTIAPCPANGVTDQRETGCFDDVAPTTSSMELLHYPSSPSSSPSPCSLVVTTVSQPTSLSSGMSISAPTSSVDQLFQSQVSRSQTASLQLPLTSSDKTFSRPANWLAGLRALYNQLHLAMTPGSTSAPAKPLIGSPARAPEVWMTSTGSHPTNSLAESFYNETNDLQNTCPSPGSPMNWPSGSTRDAHLESPDKTTVTWASRHSNIHQDNQNASVGTGLSCEEALVHLTERTLYPILQENGQRRYGPPPDWLSRPPPPRGCEVFIGKIPRGCFEDELVPIFETAGRIYMFRLMMDFSGCNRGYGFCIYTNREDARRAVTELDNYEIRRGKTLGVCFSVDNCRLFVGGIPKTRTKEEIMVEMTKVTEGVKDVIVYPSVTDKTKNRGFAFVEYDNHKAAAMARRKLIPGRIHLWGHQIAVDWAEPEREVDEDIMSKVRKAGHIKVNICTFVI